MSNLKGHSKANQANSHTKIRLKNPRNGESTVKKGVGQTKNIACVEGQLGFPGKMAWSTQLQCSFNFFDIDSFSISASAWPHPTRSSSTHRFFTREGQPRHSVIHRTPCIRPLRGSPRRTPSEDPHSQPVRRPHTFLTGRTLGRSEGGCHTTPPARKTAPNRIRCKSANQAQWWQPPLERDSP